MEMNTNTEQIEKLERIYLAATTAEPDHRWGEEQEEAVGKAAETLEAAYEAAGTPELDRIVL